MWKGKENFGHCYSQISSVWLNVVVLVCDQRRTSVIFAQASPSRLSESCRVSFWVLVRISRLGDLCQDWATYSRLGEKGSPNRGRDEACACWVRLLVQARSFEVLSDWYTRLGENGSPKRGREETLVLVTLNLHPGEEIRVFERMGSRSGKGARLSETTWLGEGP